MGNSSKRDIRRADQAEIGLKAMRLRRDGKTLEEIAKVLGLRDRSSAKRVIDRELEKIEKVGAEEAASMIYFEIARIDYDWSLSELAIGKVQARIKKRGETDERAVMDLCRLFDSRRKMQERRAAYKGLDAPKKVNVEADVKGLGELLALSFPDVGKGTT